MRLIRFLQATPNGTYFRCLAGIRSAQHNCGVRGRQTRDPPPAGGAGGRQLASRGAHQSQENSGEAARGGSGISAGKLIDTYRIYQLIYSTSNYSVSQIALLKMRI